MVRLGPSTPITASTRMMNGIDIKMSMKRLMIWSVNPPLKPAIKPSAAPSTPLTNAAEIPTTTEIWLPYSNRL